MHSKSLFYDGSLQMFLDCETLKMKLLHSIEATVSIYQTTQPDILKYWGLRHDRCRTSAIIHISFLKRNEAHRLIEYGLF